MRSNLVTLAQAYVAHKGTSLKSLSRVANGDTPFFDRLIAGEGSVSGRKHDEVMEWFGRNWPDGLKWPKLESFPVPPKKSKAETHAPSLVRSKSRP